MSIEITFSLTGGFFFIVMIPLSFIYFEHLSTSASFFDKNGAGLARWKVIAGAVVVGGGGVFLRVCLVGEKVWVLIL
jgi:hypothetical protein